ncbi:DUF3558 domain-containing protein [Saccharopolyspora erythraea]|uniref:DUF3558 domain-containing protein n=1 Tax=Saccharopolyspora erythraea (strain ATCC 11635 / DSM 40517 / JCM 4748 / NBRC 13426 / NCIMB 8594 / NRRL 2338) TaxID=405948 RepID=A4F8P3_SACEN|nr:DUF3558 domain-containing protein [Saccharopolyspora erythraea]CAM00418.1 hypothetical protein SACE_1086 [Saccharopolyspora erythraea NRRL 2338]
MSLGFALVGLSACTGQSSGHEDAESSSSATPGSGLAAFDPCTFFTPDELTSFGVSTQSEAFSPVSFRPGCAWDGDIMDITLNKDVKETVAGQDPQEFDRFTPKEIAGRSAAVAIVAGGEGTGGCNVFVDSGGGMVIYGLSGRMRDSVADPCAEVEKVAGRTASRLPE